MDVSVSRRSYAGLFLVTLSSLMFEILLTRIFSVTMWYHFAFMAISIAMFGMTVGALLVFLLPRFFDPEKSRDHLAFSALLFALAVVVSFLVHLHVPFIPRLSWTGIGSVALTFAVVAVPFVCSGVCVTIALTRFPASISRLYGADLAGAAAGCILLRYLLDLVNGPAAVLAVAALASAGAYFFAADARMTTVKRLSLYSAALFLSLVLFDSLLMKSPSSLLKVRWVKERIESRLVYEKWSSLGRVAVREQMIRTPVGWGLSENAPPARPVDQLYMDIDAAASTVLTRFDGDLQPLEYLKYDVTNLVHYLRPDSSVLVVGTGGGRDILSALAFFQKSIVGVEINRDIIHAVNRDFGDFTGHLDRDPRVTFVHDEARSYIARMNRRFDIIQVSLIDTWAATTAGAFVLAENSLYTTEAWKSFLGHLTPRGVLTFSRWYSRDLPAEMYRLTALAATALAESGVEKPRQHIMIIRHLLPKYGKALGIGTMLVGRSPFSPGDIRVIEREAGRMGFDLVLSPEATADPVYEKVASISELPAFAAAFPLNIQAPTDDAPFFFNMLRLRDALRPKFWSYGNMGFNLKAVAILGALLVVMFLLTALCIAVPLILKAGKIPLRGSIPLIGFFAAIGFGFMLVEISQMQRLNVFLGHPNYGLSVVLFILLLASSIGSFLTRKVDPVRGVSPLWPGALLPVLALFGAATPLVIRHFQAAATPLRIAVAGGLLFPIGLFMGMPFPLGMKLASARSAALTPWLWGINGAASVFASVAAMVISLGFSITASFWTGFGCYAVAFVVFWIALRPLRAQRTQSIDLSPV
jgi:hypothetical protein